MNANRFLLLLLFSLGVSLAGAQTVTLTVSSTVGGPSPADDPPSEPALGTYSYQIGSTVSVEMLSTTWRRFQSRDLYTLTGWTGTGSMTNGVGGSTGPFVITENTEIQWQWSLSRTIAVHPWIYAGGQISSDPPATDGGVLKRLTSEPIRYTATADPGFTFSYWGFENADLFERNNVDVFANPIALTTVNGPRTALLAVFERQTNPVLVQSAVPAVDPIPGEYAVRIDIPNRDPDRFSASATTPYDEDPNDGMRHVLTGWSGTGSIPDGSSATAGPFMIDQPSSLTWNWRQEWWVTVAPSANGTPTGGGVWSGNGLPATLQATPAAGYRFERWTGDVVGLTGSQLASNPLTFVADGVRELSAVFGPIPLTVTVDGVVEEYPFGSMVSIQSEEPDGSRGIRGVVTGWVGTGSVPANGTGSATTEFLLTENSTVTWLRQFEFRLRLASSTVVDRWYEPGALATINATDVTAPPGTRFLRWTGDIPAGEENRQSVTIQMLGPRNIAAEYETLFTPAGIPQPWFYENNLGNVDDNGDPDGDRISNAGEYHAGTDPMNATDFPRIADFRLDPASGRLEWPSKVGHRYTIETASSIDGPWTILMQDIGATAPRNSTALGPQSETLRLYRIVSRRE